MDEKQFMEQHLGQLVGKTVIATINDDEGFHGIQVQGPDKKKLNVWISSDEEQNGPGFLHIEEDTDAAG